MQLLKNQLTRGRAFPCGHLLLLILSIYFIWFLLLLDRLQSTFRDSKTWIPPFALLPQCLPRDLSIWEKRDRGGEKRRNWQWLGVGSQAIGCGLGGLYLLSQLVKVIMCSSVFIWGQNPLLRGAKSNFASCSEKYLTDLWEQSHSDRTTSWCNCALTCLHPHIHSLASASAQKKRSDASQGERRITRTAEIFKRLMGSVITEREAASSTLICCSSDCTFQPVPRWNLIKDFNNAPLDGGMLLYLFEGHDPHIIIFYYHAQAGIYLLGVEERDKQSQADDLLKKIHTLFTDWCLF